MTRLATLVALLALAACTMQKSGGSTMVGGPGGPSGGGGGGNPAVSGDAMITHRLHDRVQGRHVCRAAHGFGGQSGMSKSDVLVLWTNKTLSIAPPPD